MIGQMNLKKSCRDAWDMYGKTMYRSSVIWRCGGVGHITSIVIQCISDYRVYIQLFLPFLY